MKKTLLIATAFVASIFSTNAQTCVIAPVCTPTAGYCSTPSPSTSLPAGTINQAYNTTIQISVAASIPTMGFNVPINSGTITAVTGLPGGLTVVKNPTNGVISSTPGNGCLLITGTPTITGTFTITATFSVSTSLGVQGGSADWYLTIGTTAGIAQLTQATQVMLMSPNPAKSELNITADFHIAKLTIIDALGKNVLVQDVNYDYQSVLDIRGLEKGIYFLQASDGTKLITRKFIKD